MEEQEKREERKRGTKPIKLHDIWEFLMDKNKGFSYDPLETGTTSEKEFDSLAKKTHVKMDVGMVSEGIDMKTDKYKLLANAKGLPDVLHKRFPTESAVLASMSFLYDGDFNESSFFFCNIYTLRMLHSLVGSTKNEKRKKRGEMMVKEIQTTKTGSSMKDLFSKIGISKVDLSLLMGDSKSIAVSIGATDSSNKSEVKTLGLTYDQCRVLFSFLIEEARNRDEVVDIVLLVHISTMMHRIFSIIVDEKEQRSMSREWNSAWNILDRMSLDARGLLRVEKDDSPGMHSDLCLLLGIYRSCYPLEGGGGGGKPVTLVTPFTLVEYVHVAEKIARSLYDDTTSKKRSISHRVKERLFRCIYLLDYTRKRGSEYGFYYSQDVPNRVFLSVDEREILCHNEKLSEVEDVPNEEEEEGVEEKKEEKEEVEKENAKSMEIDKSEKTEKPEEKDVEMEGQGTKPEKKYFSIDESVTQNQLADNFFKFMARRKGYTRKEAADIIDSNTKFYYEPLEIERKKYKDAKLDESTLTDDWAHLLDSYEMFRDESTNTTGDGFKTKFSDHMWGKSNSELKREDYLEVFDKIFSRKDNKRRDSNRETEPAKVSFVNKNNDKKEILSMAIISMSYLAQHALDYYNKLKGKKDEASKEKVYTAIIKDFLGQFDEIHKKKQQEEIPEITILDASYHNCFHYIMNEALSRKIIGDDKSQFINWCNLIIGSFVKNATLMKKNVNILDEKQNRGQYEVIHLGGKILQVFSDGAVEFMGIYNGVIAPFPGLIPVIDENVQQTDKIFCDVLVTRLFTDAIRDKTKNKGETYYDYLKGISSGPVSMESRGYKIEFTYEMETRSDSYGSYDQAVKVFRDFAKSNKGNPTEITDTNAGDVQFLLATGNARIMDEKGEKESKVSEKILGEIDSLVKTDVNVFPDGPLKPNTPDMLQKI